MSIQPRTKHLPIGKGEPNVQCPFCKGTETELYALFGSMLSTSQYYCRRCRVAFERMKWSKPAK
ncbi:hypothetical protein HY229_04410 [Candidatus Acetothermia bacterium]|nr:hypothetical protein [Candidatus Acetothermia bacterium]MBI3643328.1 hypothetical protein [Candidatus Acetothermia bacterium]